MVEIQIVTYERLDQAVRCLGSLEPTLAGIPDLRCRIWDNGSTDPRLHGYLDAYAKKWSGKVEVIKHPRNLRNTLARKALFERAAAKYIVELDSDVTIVNGAEWLKKLLAVMDNDPSIGVAGPTGTFVRPGWQWTVDPPPDYIGQVDAIYGYCQIFRAEHRQAGLGYDAQFAPQWWEDTDICMQVARLGFKVWATGDIGVQHKWGSTGQEEEARQENTQRFCAKWRGHWVARVDQRLGIPKKIHFCFGFAPKQEPFHLFHYLAVKSAKVVNPQYDVHIYYAEQPSGQWWEMCGEFATFHQVPRPTEICGHRLHHFAHRADVFRLKQLQNVGGIYLDMDTLCLRSFDPLLNNECVMGVQGNRKGLCNAVILAAPRSPFISAWLDEYRDFRSEGRDPFWDEHSVHRPMKLSKLPELSPHLTVLPQKAFYYPDWNQPMPLFRGTNIRPWKRSYVVHLWEQVNMPHLREYNPALLMASKTAYCRLAQRYMPVGSTVA